MYFDYLNTTTVSYDDEICWRNWFIIPYFMKLIVISPQGYLLHQSEQWWWQILFAVSPNQSTSERICANICDVFLSDRNWLSITRLRYWFQFSLSIFRGSCRLDMTGEIHSIRWQHDECRLDRAKHDDYELWDSSNARAFCWNHEQILNKHADILPNFPTFAKTIVLSKRCILTLKTTNVCYGYDNRIPDAESLLRQLCSYEYD